jgi:chromosome segregation ATPase
MTDYTELKRLAEAAQYENNETNRDLRKTTAAFFAGCIPEQILALIAENERLTADLDGEVSQARDFNIEHEELKHECDQLKAENEALRKAISDLHGALEREYWSEYAGLEETRAILDVAMGKAVRP